MNDPERRSPGGEEADQDESDWGQADLGPSHATMGLRLTPTERLRWLERTMEELRRVLGRARQGRPIRDDP